MSNKAFQQNLDNGVRIKKPEKMNSSFLLFFCGHRKFTGRICQDLNNLSLHKFTNNCAVFERGLSQR